VGAPTSVDNIDGLATTHLEAPPDGPAEHPLGIAGFDHLVVMTSSLERTCAAIEAATGEPLKRIREAGAIRQGFHRLGELIIEVVESPQVTRRSRRSGVSSGTSPTCTRRAAGSGRRWCRPRRPRCSPGGSSRPSAPRRSSGCRLH
jgi:hypothetical protein